MKTFRIPVTYEVYGEYFIQAETEEDAIRQVEEGEITESPIDLGLIEGTIKVDEGGLESQKWQP